jgi:putative ABC transport system permease protein
VAAEPSLPYIPVRTLTSIVDEQLQSWRVAAMLFTVFGGLGLLVAALGLYSVIAHDVAQRAQEIGVRMALGARRSDVVRLVMRRGVAQALVGVGLGLAIAAALSPRVADLLFETSPRDPLIYGIVLVLLVAVAIVATAVPARRASRLDPVEVLKES